MVPETGIEPVTLSLEGSCSIQLSYSGREVCGVCLYLYNSVSLFKDGWYYMENWRKARGILTEYTKSYSMSSSSYYDWEIVPRMSTIF